MENGRNWIERTAQARNLEENEYLEGKLMEIETLNMTPILVIKTAENGIEKVWQSTQLRYQLDQADIGKYIGIQYLGEATAKSGRKFRFHKVWIAEEEEPKGGDKGD